MNSLKGINFHFHQVEDYLPSEWFSPMTDGSEIEGKPKTKRGLLAMKKGVMEVTYLFSTKIEESQNEIHCILTVF